MPRKPYLWTPINTEIFTNLYLGKKPVEMIAREFGCSVSAVYDKACKLGLKRGSGRLPKPFKLRKYTQQQFDTVRYNYPNMSNRTLVLVSGVCLGGIKKWAYIHGWRKSEQYKEECREHAVEKARKTRRAWTERNRERIRAKQRECRQRKRNGG